jgi:hypothetical protein
MPQHDPDRKVQQKALALKYGRQKRIQIIDGHQVLVDSFFAIFSHFIIGIILKQNLFISLPFY